MAAAQPMTAGRPGVTAGSAGVVPAGVTLVAALASCHMLWFLSIAARRGFCVQAYRDQASGVMGPGARGKLCMTAVTLRPHAVFTSTKIPATETVVAMHEEAHGQCYIANSVTTRLTTIPTFEVTAGETTVLDPIAVAEMPISAVRGLVVD